MSRRRHLTIVGAAFVAAAGLGVPAPGAGAAGPITFQVAANHHDGVWATLAPGIYDVVVSGTWTSGDGGIAADAECTSTAAGPWSRDAYTELRPPFEDSGQPPGHFRGDWDVVHDRLDLHVGRHPGIGLPFRIHENVEEREGRNVEWEPATDDGAGCDPSHTYSGRIVVAPGQVWTIFRITPPDPGATGSLTVTLTDVTG